MLSCRAKSINKQIYIHISITLEKKLKNLKKKNDNLIDIIYLIVFLNYGHNCNYGIIIRSIVSFGLLFNI